MSVDRIFTAFKNNLLLPPHHRDDTFFIVYWVYYLLLLKTKTQERVGAAAGDAGVFTIPDITLRDL